MRPGVPFSSPRTMNRRAPGGGLVCLVAGNPTIPTVAAHTITTREPLSPASVARRRSSRFLFQFSLHRAACERPYNPHRVVTPCHAASSNRVYPH